MKIGKQKFVGLSLLIVFTLVLTACGGSSKEPTPTPVDPNLIAAQAIATFSMGLTQTAFANPTATFTLTPVPTNTTGATFAPLGTSTNAALPTSACDVSAFITDVTVPDGTVMAPGQNFDKTWRIQNSGTCAWTATYKAAFTGSGNGALGGVTTPIGKIVNPGDTIDITVEFVAPATAGDYVSWWKLQNDASVFFGTPFSVAIKVVGAATTPATPTETPTATP
ncbi:MAG: hypothetical protein C4583_02400 [Anaerolineaceae bacterium]|nr:MAG: hypothetical protein C4583_02400 [Anaerolineaceae bacterium]